MSRKWYTISLDEEIQHLTLQIQQKINKLPDFLSNEELQMIRGAMSSSFVEGIRAQGYWCKCVNSHINCITKCGRPMELSSCPECDEEIGRQD
ncbi:NFX1-type zinc finger-containing protein 1-like [Aphis craccivora]|uniref:NFX1-type zinc finger-containing protein 1-like n=1 Tax=Aphis craccivora TaxID=307492 RepID=A0A6G0VT51_APHCR|nr:NFX1-type zinc finger-containing protein 1-like [Aphis craccivora]